MKKLLFVFAAMLLASGVWAGGLPELLTVGPAVKTGQGFAAAAPAGVYAVRLNSAVQEIAVGGEVKLGLPGLSYSVIFERSQRLPSGNLSWVGYLKEAGRDYRVILTTGMAGTSGRILTPNGEYLIEPSAEGDRLINVRETGMKPVPVGDDEKTPPLHEFDLQMALPSPNVFAAIPSPQSTIDVMVLYTPGLVSAQTRIDQLVTLANQAYIDSEVAITLRLVHAAQVSYTDTNDNSTALTDLSDGLGALSGVSTLRNAYGADLVVLLRPYKNAYNGSCGVGWVPWNNGQPATYQESYGYSVVSDGSDGRYYCVDYTFAHELGHNMGSKHDRANNSSGAYGAYTYSFGYGIDGSFGTIMSYINPVIGRFSNPYLRTCKGQPCGVSEYDTANSANNALSLNNTRTVIAAFRGATMPAPGNPGVLQFTASGSSVAESGGNVVLSVARTGGTSGSASIRYATASGTAMTGQDFTAVSGTLNWADGEGTSKTISIPILNDTQTESSETFSVSLSGASLGSPVSVTVTITDDDFTPAPGTCSASLSSSWLLNIPIINLGGGAYAWVELMYIPSSDGTLWFVLNDLGQANPAAFNCTPPVFGSWGEIVLPDMKLGNTSYWVRLVYKPTSDPYYWFYVESYRQN